MVYTILWILSKYCLNNQSSYSENWSGEHCYCPLNSKAVILILHLLYQKVIMWIFWSHWFLCLSCLTWFLLNLSFLTTYNFFWNCFWNFSNQIGVLYSFVNRIRWVEVVYREELQILMWETYKITTKKTSKNKHFKSGLNEKTYEAERPYTQNVGRNACSAVWTVTWTMRQHNW